MEIRTRSLFGTVAIAAIFGVSATAQQGGERVLLFVDPTNADALHVANVYAEARSIPGNNVLYLDPDAPNYSTLVAGPMEGMLGEIVQRGLDASLDFVVLAPSDEFRVSASGLVNDACQPVQHFGLASSYGLYDYRANLLNPGQITAPDANNQFARNNWRGHTFRGADSWLFGSVVEPPMTGGRRMLIPARLGWTGDLGNTVSEVTEMIGRSVLADGSAPTGTVYYMQTNDLARSSPRHFIYPTAVERMLTFGGAAEHLFDVLPLGRNDALGIMTGAANPAIDAGGFTLLPGSFADHLTSFAGNFATTSQTKMSRWIAAGASGTSGAIEEPCNYAQKFPHPRVHTTYLTGASLGEAWFRSREAIPLQSMFLGDPLTRPWPLGPTVSVAGVPQGPVTGVLTLTPSATANPATGNLAEAHELFVDGVLVERVDDGADFVLDTASLAAGPHSLLVRSEDDSNFRHVGHWAGELQVAGGLSATLTVAPLAIDLDGSVQVDVAAAGDTVEEIVVRHLGRVAGAVSGPSGQLEFFGRQLGSGPVRLVAEARFVGGGRAVSAPFTIDVSETLAGAADVAPTAYGYRRTLSGNQAFVLDLPSSFSGAIDGATYQLVTPPAMASALTGAQASMVFEPAPSAHGVDLVQFQVTTSQGVSDVATIQIEYAAQSASDPELFCRSSPNSAGGGARLGWSGSTSLVAQDLELRAAGLPEQSFGIMIRGQGLGEVPVGDGQLCVLGSQVRLAVLQADAAGLVQWTVQNTTGSTAATAGSTWGFQLWHRDVVGAGSSFTDGVLVTFQP